MRGAWRHPLTLATPQPRGSSSASGSRERAPADAGDETQQDADRGASSSIQTLLRLTGWDGPSPTGSGDSRFRLSETEWKEIRSRPDRFAVAPGHVADVEVVVKKCPNFWVVEKRGEAEEIAEELD